MEKYTAIKERADKYTNILQQVIDFREAWEKNLKNFILYSSKKVLKHTGIYATTTVVQRFDKDGITQNKL